MGRRRDKGLAVSRYLLGQTGIPFIEWTKEGISAPYPLRFDLQTEATHWKYWDAVKKLPDNDELPFVIRYDAYIENITDAVVTMKMHTFVRLIQEWAANNEANIRPRKEED